MRRRRSSENLDEKQEADQEIDATSQENGVEVEEEPVKKENDSKVKLRRIDSSDEARSSEKKKGEIKTAFFGRGFEDFDGE